MDEPTTAICDAPVAADMAGKYLTFKLGQEEYGLEILKVQEIIKVMDITTVPRTPTSVRGVINLRGKVIAVVDLRLKFDMDAVGDTDSTCIIMVQVASGDEKVIMGIVVDAVSEVVDISADAIEPPPAMGASVNTQFILGLAKIEKSVKMLLDIDKILSRDEMTRIADAA